jgi:hypothetical protein
MVNYNTIPYKKYLQSLFGVKYVRYYILYMACHTRANT